MFLTPLRKQHCAATLACAVLAISSAFNLIGAWAQSTPAATMPENAHIEEVLRGLNRGRAVGQVAISPDGKRLAWTEGGRGGGAILVAATSDLGKNERVSGGGQAGSALPRRAAFVDAGLEGAGVLFRLRGSGGAPVGYVSFEAGRKPGEEADCAEGVCRRRPRFRRTGPRWRFSMWKVRHVRQGRWRQ